MRQEKEEIWLAVWMANKALDVPNADPDSEICTISRQFLRLREQLANYQTLVQDLRKELQESRILNNDTYEELLKERQPSKWRIKYDNLDTKMRIEKDADSYDMNNWGHGTIRDHYIAGATNENKILSEKLAALEFADNILLKDLRDQLEKERNKSKNKI